MNLNRDKLYKIILFACLVGYIWIYLGIFHGIYQNNNFETCFIKKITNIPCPSCGTSRSVKALLTGHFKQAFLLNPFGYLVTLILMIAPIWISIDYIRKKQSFFNFYRLMEQRSTNIFVIIIFIFLVLTNWVWNIQKHL